jgi:hypothetical protein
MKEVCVRLGEVGWNVLPDADVEKLAEAELAMPADGGVSPATMKLKVERLEKRTASLEAEKVRLMRRAAAVDGLEAEVERLKSENAGPKGEVARLTTEICGLQSVAFGLLGLLSLGSQQLLWARALSHQGRFSLDGSTR